MRKIVVSFPSGDTVKTDFAISLWGLLASSGKGDVAYSLGNQQGCYVDMNRNLIVASALQHNQDALLFIDTDMVVPTDLGAILNAHDKDIVGCDYVRRYEPYDLCGRTLDGQPFGTTGLRDMESLGAGALLIRTGVFKRMKVPWFYNEYAGEWTGEDRIFCRDARAAGFQIWCDQGLSRQVSHYGGVHLRMK